MLSKIKKGFKKHGMSILFSLPFMLLFFAFVVIPVFMAICISFMKYDILRPAEFVGLKNYLNLFLDDDVFLTALKNTILFGVIYSPLSMLACMITAWIINDYSKAVRTVLTFVFYAPSLTGGLYTIWALILSGDSYGILNSVLTQLGIITTPQQWLTDTKYLFTILLIVSLWGCLGTGFLSFVAAFRGLDVSLYEAAAIDGIRNRIQELWYITLSSLRPQLIFTALTSVTGGFGVGAVSETLFGNPSTNYAAHTLTLHMTDYAGLRMDQGAACVIAVVLFALMVGGNNVIKKFVNRIGR